MLLGNGCWTINYPVTNTGATLATCFHTFHPCPSHGSKQSSTPLYSPVKHSTCWYAGTLCFEILSAILGNGVVLLLQKQMHFFRPVDPQTHVLLFFSSCAIQPCCRSDGNSGLEVHGGVSPTPGCRSLPLSGFSPVPFSWTPTQAPQTILTASLLGISTHTHSHKHSHTTNHNVSPLTHRTNIPLAVTCYTYLHPAPRHFSPIHSCCICSS